MKTVKLIALDLDGTIVHGDQSISAEDIAAIGRAQRAGIPVVIATGRIFPTLRNILPGLHITTPIICSNGADVRVEGQTIYSQTMENSWLRKAYGAMEKYCSQRFIFCGNHIWCEKGTVNETLFRKWGYDPAKNDLVQFCDDAESLMQTAGDGAVKFLACTQSERRHAEMLREIISLGYFDAVKGERLHFELTRKGVSKAVALKFVADRLGVDMQDVLAIGDSTNDLEMIRHAGLGIAMGNSMPELLAVADDVTLSIEQSGVACAIEKYVFKEIPCSAAVVG